MGATLTILLATASIIDADHRLRPERLTKQTRGRKLEHRLQEAILAVGISPAILSVDFWAIHNLHVLDSWYFAAAQSEECAEKPFTAPHRRWETASASCGGGCAGHSQPMRRNETSCCPREAVAAGQQRATSSLSTPSSVNDTV